MSFLPDASLLEILPEVYRHPAIIFYSGWFFAISRIGQSWEIRSLKRTNVDLEASNRELVRTVRERLGLTINNQGATTGMFPLSKRSIGGYRFRQRTWYTQYHLGVDYAADGDTLYAPFDGEIVDAHYSWDIGNCIWFRPDNAHVQMRFMHLKSFLVGKGRVSQGQAIAITGNTGVLTTGPHLHLDIATNYDSPTYFKDINNFVDPEQYDWNPATLHPVAHRAFGTLKPGTTSQAVTVLQQRLRDLGFFTFARNTDYYGYYTAKAVLAFQKDRGIIPQDAEWPHEYPSNDARYGAGYFGPRTAAALSAIS